MRGLLGGKGANLAEMTRIGVPVPPGFTVTTEACNAYLAGGGAFPDGMWEQAIRALKAVEAETGKKFGDAQNPLLVSCRSGAKFSMPGMMDTVLNIGLNDEIAEGMVALTGDAALRLRLPTAAWSRCSAPSSWASRTKPSRRCCPRPSAQGQRQAATPT